MSFRTFGCWVSELLILFPCLICKPLKKSGAKNLESMCGRTALTKAAGEIMCACAYKGKDGETKTPKWKENKGLKTYSKYSASYNLGPKSYSPILIRENSPKNERALMPMQWGLIPSWHKGSPKNFAYNMINCRLDSIQEKKSFSNALKNGQRCVVLSEGFYEWMVEGSNKQPYFIQFKPDVKPHTNYDGELENSGNQLLTMAGIYDKQISEEVGELYSYSIITVEASSSMKWLHHRMPAILETAESIEKWLDVDGVAGKEALELLKPTHCLEWHPVSSFVNNVRNDSEECVKKIDLVKEKEKKARSSNVMANWLKKAEKRKVEKDTDTKKKLKLKIET